MVSLRQIFQDHFADYAQGKTLPLDWHKAAGAIAHCRTETLGGVLEACEAHPDALHPVYFSCRHRACPRCAGKAKAEWLDRQQRKLLDVPHAHVVFTLPHDLLDLWRFNRRFFIDLQFRASLETLQTLLGEDRYLGATPGILAALHTHGRDLGLHPHIHCLVTCGGLDPAGHWRELPRSILLPARVVRALYRGKLLAGLTEALAAGTLAWPPSLAPAAGRRLIAALYRKTFNVRLQRSYRHGRGVAIYLARYIKGGPLSERRLVRADSHTVSFRYTRHQDGHTRVMTLPTPRFLERLLTHVPVTGKPTVRYAGLYSPRQSARLESLRPPRAEAFPMAPVPPTPRTCPHCSQPLRLVGRIGPRGLNFLITKVSATSGATGATGGAQRVRATGRSSVTRPPASGERWEKTGHPPPFFGSARMTLN